MSSVRVFRSPFCLIMLHISKTNNFGKIVKKIDLFMLQMLMQLYLFFESQILFEML